jgi:micrococcal nuclease
MTAKSYRWLLVSLMLGAGIAPNAHARIKEFAGRVVGVADGDTITVLYKGRGYKVRLYGIDAPEKKQPFGYRAKQHLSALVYGKDVVVRVRARDRYRRWVGDVILPDGRYVNAEMMKAGMTWWYSRYAPRESELKRLEYEARRARVGLWADQRPVPPWLYRSALRERARG